VHYGIFTNKEQVTTTMVYPDKDAAQAALDLLDKTDPPHELDTCSEQGERLVRVPDEVFKAASADASAVMGDTACDLAMNTMVNARNLYTLAVNALMARLDGELLEVVPGGPRRKAHALAGELLVQTAADASQKAFDVEILFKQFQEVTMPWLKQVTEALVTADKKEQANRNAEQERIRREALVPIGFRLAPGEPEAIHRGLPVILVGYAPAVRFLVNHAVNAALTAKPETGPARLSVLHLTNRQLYPGNNSFYCPIPRQQWHGIARTARGFVELFRVDVFERIASVPDLLVVDNLVAAADNSPLPFTSRAGQALKRLTDVVGQKTGTAVLAAIPFTDTKPVVLDTPHWENLKAYATLRPVYVLDEAEGLEQGKRRIVVGVSAWHIDVDASLLAEENLIITP
jgi:hypothetical protein